MTASVKERKNPQYKVKKINGKTRYVHRLLMEKYLGRKLKREEFIHHKNGDRLDNCIGNLELWHKGQPAGQRVEDKINWAIEFLKDYGYTVVK